MFYRRKTALFVIVAAILFVTSCRKQTATSLVVSDPEKILYKTVGDTHLYLHTFKPITNDRKKPAIVFFFGGCWARGEPEQFYQHCKYFASRGMLAMSAEYRVTERNGTSPFECVADGKSAVRWIRENAAKLGVDPDRIVAAGGSAGGHIAACTGIIAGFEEKSENLNISSKPNALVLFNPVMDTTEKGFGAELLEGRTTEISPAHHVKKGDPPTIIFHGTADTIVPFENVQRFCRLMNQAHNRCELVGFEGKDHAFFNYGRDPDNSSYILTVRAADKFLSSLGFLKGPPTL